MQRNLTGALSDMMHALRIGHAPEFQVYVLVRFQGVPRYIALTKSFHLVHFAQLEGPDPATSWPGRTTQLLDSLFLSRAHAQSCLDAESNAAEPLQGWRARKWASLLVDEAFVAHCGGRLLLACRALLLRSLFLGLAAGLADEKTLELVPTVGRMLSSTAARLHELSDLGRTIHGVLECANTEEHNLKVDNQALVAMLHCFRAPVVQVLAIESAYNFEAFRSTVQGAFYALLLDIRTMGVLDVNGVAPAVVETVIDYLVLIEVCLAHQVVSCAPPVIRERLKEVLRSRPRGPERELRL